MLYKKLMDFFRKAEENSAPSANKKSPSPLPSRTHELAAYRQEDGSYCFRLKIVKGITNRCTEEREPDALGIECELDGFSPTQHGRHRDLMNVQYIAASAKFSLSLNYDIEEPRIYFGEEGGTMLVDGDDELAGLSPGKSYFLLAVPKGVDAPLNIHPKSIVPKNGCPVTQPAFK